MRNFKIFAVFSVIVLIIVLIGVLFEKEIFIDFAAPLLWPSNVTCYFLRSRGILELGAGEWDEAMLIPDRCIFFLETGCFGARGTGAAILDQRRACAVESAARTNPAMNIFLLYLTPKNFSGVSAGFVRELESYDNVYVRHVSLVTYFENTPLEEWFSRNMRIVLGDVDSRESIFELVRLATLWKYGGIFADLGLVLETPLETFTNFAAKWKPQNDSTALLSFGVSTELGKLIADFSLDEVINGETVSVARIIERFCGKANINDRKPEAHESIVNESLEILRTYRVGSISGWRDELRRIFNLSDAREVLHRYEQHETLSKSRSTNRRISL